MKNQRSSITEREPAYKLVATEFERLVMQGEIAPGEPLPNETELAARFDVNRSTIRESIRVLEADGYIERVSPRKLVASRPTVASLAERTSQALLNRRVTLRDVWQANLAIEPVMARFAAQRATEEQIARLKANVDAIRERIENGHPLDDLDEAFHKELGFASNHAALQIAREPFSTLFLEVVDGLVHHSSINDRLLIAHTHIVEAIDRRDGEVAELWTRRHAEDFERGCVVANINIDIPLSVFRENV